MLPMSSSGPGTNSADVCLVRHGLVLLATEWVRKKCSMYESDSIRERMRPGGLFINCALATMSPVEMRVPGLSVFGARLLEAAGLTFDQVGTAYS